MGMILTPELYSFTTDQPPVDETTSQQDVTTNTNQIPMTLFSSFQQQESLKLILVIRSDLKMSTGKIAAQCVHAAIGVLDGISSSGTPSKLTYFIKTRTCFNNNINNKQDKWIMFVIGR